MTPKQQEQILDAAIAYGAAFSAARALPWQERDVAQKEAAIEFGKTLKAVYAPTLPEAVHAVVFSSAYVAAGDGFVTTTEAIERHYSSQASLARAILKVV